MKGERLERRTRSFEWNHNLLPVMYRNPRALNALLFELGRWSIAFLGSEFKFNSEFCVQVCHRLPNIYSINLMGQINIICGRKPNDSKASKVPVSNMQAVYLQLFL